MMPRIFGSTMVGTGVLLMVRVSFLLWSLVSGEKMVAVDLSGFSWRSFSIVQVWIWSRYGWRLACAIL